MSDRYILNEAGEPVPEPDLVKWALWLGSAGRRVAITEIGKITVSTVFLGCDHSFGRGQPILFETVVFGGPLNEEQERYHTRAEAIAGHVTMLARVQAALASDVPAS